MTKRTPWYPILMLTVLAAVLFSRPAQAAEVHTNTMQDVRQLVLVTTSSKTSSYATVTAYERSSSTGKWISRKKTTGGRVGWSGIQPIASRKQGTGKTPQGILRLTGAMGVQSDPGAKFSYTKITDKMYWNLNSGSKTYNRLVTKDPGGDREHLISYANQYAYLFTTDYNTEQVSGKGGAIFFHCSGSGATAGCVSVPKSVMKWYMQWLDPQKNPVMLVTTKSDVQRYLAPSTAITSVQAQKAGSLTVSWKQVYGTYRYVVQRASSASGPYRTVRILKPSVTSWTDTSANPKQTYYYRIKTYTYLDGVKSCESQSKAVCNITYTIRYRANGGTGSMKTTTGVYGLPTALRSNSFRRSGYTFAGWTAYRVSDKKWYTVGHSWQTAAAIRSKGYETYQFADRQKVSRLTSVSGGSIRMVAVWHKKGSAQS